MGLMSFLESAVLGPMAPVVNSAVGLMGDGADYASHQKSDEQAGHDAERDALGLVPFFGGNLQNNFDANEKADADADARTQAMNNQDRQAFDDEYNKPSDYQRELQRSARDAKRRGGKLTTMNPDGTEHVRDYSKDPSDD
jgi:hypothetical protein